MNKYPEVGKDYRIVGYSSFYNGKVFTVTSRDGEYILGYTTVPHYGKVSLELYTCELEEIEDD